MSDKPTIPNEAKRDSLDSHSREDALSLDHLVRILIQGKRGVVLITLLSVLVSVAYCFWVTPTYQASIAFVPSGNLFVSQKIPESIFKIEKNTPKVLFHQLLTLVGSYQHQLKVFRDEGFEERFFDPGEYDSNTDDLFYGIYKSISIRRGEKKTRNSKSEDFQKAVYVDFVGYRPKVMADFLTAIVETANEKVGREELEVIEERVNDKISFSLQEIEIMRNEVEHHLEKRLQILSDNLIVAEKFHLDGNKFLLPSANEELAKGQSVLSIKKGSLILGKWKGDLPDHLEVWEKEVPLWLLYGASALKQEIGMLKTKRNNDRYLSHSIIHFKQVVRVLRKVDVSKMRLNPAKVSQVGLFDRVPVWPNKLLVMFIGLVLGLFSGVLVTFYNAYKKTF
jgi:LPS O-antigen subunit length determinant protein (WzzB/FepE family)